MTTFERVKKRILKDMAASTTHNAESWVNIMLRNTALLTNVEEQKKFWEFIQNPEEDERPPPQIDVFETHLPDDIPNTVDIEGPLHHQDVVWNGQSVRIRVKGPVCQDDEKVQD